MFRVISCLKVIENNVHYAFMYLDVSEVFLFFLTNGRFKYDQLDL